VISRPALEKARSADAEVAGIARKSFAILAKTGYLLWFAFQHCKGESLKGAIAVSYRYVLDTLEVVHER